MTTVQKMTDRHKKFFASFPAKEIGSSVPSEMVFFPVGKHSITASQGGEAVEIEIEITKEVSDLLDAQLKASIAASLEGKESRPFIDFNHEEGRAAALPTGFRWEEGKGVMVQLEWTPSGKQAVEGKEFSYFSPSWLMKDGKVSGLALPGPIGGLVNTPAFQTIPKIAAKFKPMEKFKIELIKILTELKLLTEEAAKDISDSDALAMLKDILANSQVAEAKLNEAVTDSQVKASKLSQSESDLITAKAANASLLKQHKEELEAAKASVAAEVAKVIHACGLAKPIDAKKVSEDFSETEITREKWEKMDAKSQKAFFKNGGKLK